MTYFFYIYSAIKIILTEIKYRFIFILLWFGLFSVMFYLPIASVPGNDTFFQAKLFTAWDYGVLTVFSGLSALVLAMQVKIFHTTRQLHHMGQASLGAVSGFIATLFATSTCTLCLGALVTFLGAGTVFTLVENRLWLVAGSLGLLFFSLYLSSKRLVDGCEDCQVRPLNS